MKKEICIFALSRIKQISAICLVFNLITINSLMSTAIITLRLFFWLQAFFASFPYVTVINHSSESERKANGMEFYPEADLYSCS